jgi:hypothetical protein
MAIPAGESNAEVLRLDFDRRLMLQFRESVVTSLRVQKPMGVLVEDWRQAILDGGIVPSGVHPVGVILLGASR